MKRNALFLTALLLLSAPAWAQEEPRTAPVRGPTSAVTSDHGMAHPIKAYKKTNAAHQKNIGEAAEIYKREGKMVVKKSADTAILYKEAGKKHAVASDDTAEVYKREGKMVTKKSADTAVLYKQAGKNHVENVSGNPGKWWEAWKKDTAQAPE